MNNRQFLTMSMPASQQTSPSAPEEKNTDVASKPKKDLALVKYILGACVLAASAIASVKIYKMAKNAKISKTSANSNETEQRFRDNFLEKIKSVAELVKFDDAPMISKPLGKSGIKLVNDIVQDTNLKRTRFFNKKGKEFASVFWDEKGGIFSYSLKNEFNRVIRTYNEHGDKRISVYSYNNSKSLAKDFLPKE